MSQVFSFRHVSFSPILLGFVTLFEIRNLLPYQGRRSSHSLPEEQKKKKKNWPILNLC